MAKKKEIKKGKKNCMFCSKKINLDDKEQQYVLLGTYNRIKKPDDEQYFHFVCFVDWFNQRVLEKAKNNVKAMQEKAMGLFNHPIIKGVLSQIQGSGNILSMLNTPLEEQYVEVHPDTVARKIDDDRNRKKRGKGKKAKM